MISIRQMSTKKLSEGDSLWWEISTPHGSSFSLFFTVRSSNRRERLNNGHFFPQTELASVGVLAGLIEGPVVVGHHRGASASSKLL